VLCKAGGVRILHISDCYLPRLGGIEVQVADLVHAQSEAGHEVEVATATPGERVPGVHRIVARLPSTCRSTRAAPGICSA
jgi:hypothetical protein